MTITFRHSGSEPGAKIEFNWQEVEKKGLNNGQKLLQKRNKTEEPSSLKALQSSKNF